MLYLEQKADLAQMAYEQDVSVMIEQLAGMFGIDILDIEPVYIPRTDTEGFMARVDDTCIIGFSGTESLCDLRHDLIFLPAAYHGGYIHAGFKMIINDIRGPVINAIRSLSLVDPVKNIIAIGHSLGASIAMGACDILYFSGYDSVPMEITTFGCPNGWSRGATEGFNTRHPDTTNYINHFDYVTWMLGITTGRPGKDVKLSGKWGHMMKKYIANVKKIG